MSLDDTVENIDHQLQVVTLRCSAQNFIEFSYTTKTTISDLQEYLLNVYKIPVELQLIYKSCKRYGCDNNDLKITDIVPKEDSANFLFAVRLSNNRTIDDDQWTMDEIIQSCSENDITIVETITIRFMSGVVLDLVQVKDHPDWKVLADLKKYISENHYKGKFYFCNEHSDGFFTDRSLVYLFLDKTKKYFRRNLNLIFIPNTSNPTEEDLTFLDKHQTDIFQTIRLKFITKEEVIRTSNRLNVGGLKTLIKERFGYGPYQQILFHNKRQLNCEELVSDIYLSEYGEGISKTSFVEALVINVALSKARLIEVRCNCYAFKVESNHEGSSVHSQFVLNVEDNLLVKDLRQIVKDRIGSNSIRIDFNHLDDVMLCEIRFPPLYITVCKIIHIKFIWNREGDSSLVYDRPYEVKRVKETVGEMIKKLELSKLKLKDFKFDPDKNETINLETVLTDLDFGTFIYFRKSKNRKCNII